MALQLGALREALISAGTPTDLANKAAEEVASYENRLNAIDGKITALDGKITLLAWMVGFSITLTLALGIGNLYLSLQILSRLPTTAT